MRIRITKSGIYNQDGPVPIGTELDVPDDFKGWANKYEVVSRADKLEVASPAEPDTDLEDARAEYEATFGEKPHARMKAETIRRKLGEASNEG